jgi:hypothetical protein
MSSGKDRSRPTPREPGRLAQVGQVELRSYDVGALPLVNHILDKMRLEGFLSERLPPDDPRAELPTAQGLMVRFNFVLTSFTTTLRPSLFTARMPARPKKASALAASTRARRMQRALSELKELRGRLAGPRTRWRERAKVEQAVERILSEHELSGIVVVPRRFGRFGRTRQIYVEFRP